MLLSYLTLYGSWCKSYTSDVRQVPFGVIFADRETKLCLSNHNLYYTFALAYPSTGVVNETKAANFLLEHEPCNQMPVVVPKRTRNRNASVCEHCISRRLCNFLDAEAAALTGDLSKMSKVLEDVVKEVKSVTPHFSSKNAKRHIFSFVGDILNVLTGSPNEAQFQDLLERVADIENFDSNVNSGFQNVTRYLNYSLLPLKN